MAAVASLAFPLLEDSMQRDRVNRAEETLNNIRQSLADGAYTRYISDMGMPPDPDTGINPDGSGNILRLMHYDNRFPAANITFPVGDGFDSVEMICGWNGPYLELSPSASLRDYGKGWLDPWGKEWEYLDKDGVAFTPASGNDRIYGLRSKGSDGKTGNESKDWHAADIERIFASPVGTGGDSNLATVIVDVYFRDGAGQLMTVGKGDFTIPPDSGVWSGPYPKYATGTVIRHEDEGTLVALYRCSEVVFNPGSGISGDVIPDFADSASENQSVGDSALIWQYVGAHDGSIIRTWQSEAVYLRNERISSTIYGGCWKCAEIQATGAKSAPAWPSTPVHGSSITDHQLLWSCVYPPPSGMLNTLRAAIFQPGTEPGESERGLTRIMALKTKAGNVTTYSESITYADDSVVSMAAPDYTEVDIPSTFNRFKFVNISPGRKVLQVSGQLEASNGEIFNACKSGAVMIDLKAGINYLKAELRQ